MTSSPPPPSTPTPSPTTDPNAARDLGFGVRVAGDTRLRLLNRDGTFNVVRRGAKGLRGFAPYHTLLTMGWWRFLTIVALLFLAINTLFAVAYFLCGDSALVGPGFPGFTPAGSNFLRAFFFSVETFGTIGYGSVYPLGIPAHSVMTAEAMVTLISVALMTGVVFARFSRPTAQILYSKHAVIAPYQDKSAFMFRCANERNNQLIEVSVKVLYSRLEERNGVRTRAFTTLPLEFEKVTFFTLSWTVVHPIDSNSPLNGCTHEDLVNNEAEFLILVTGTDETFAQIVHSRTSYRADELLWGAKFRPMFVESKSAGVTGMDLNRIHDVERVTL